MTDTLGERMAKQKKITVTATILMDGPESASVKEYQATAETLKEARFLAEKKARAYLRRRNLSVTMENVVKERCPDCETKTTFTVHDARTWSPPDPLDGLQGLKWFLDDYNWAPEGYSNA